MKTFCRLLLFVLILCPLARAQEKEHALDKNLQACQDKNPSTAGEVECIVAAYQMWDKELNRGYNELGRKLSAAGRQALRVAQLEWIKHRDAEFRLIDNIYAGLEGTMYIPMRAYSRMKVVKARAMELDNYLRLLNEHRR